MNRQDKKKLPSSPHPRAPRRAGLVAATSMALLLALVLSACGGGSSTTGTAGGSSGSSSSGSSVPGAEAATVADNTTPKKGGTINYAHEQETPCLTGGWVQEAYIERQLADSLVSQTKTGKIVPWLATSWSTSSNGLSWTFKLKPGVKFTNGEPLTAQAVAENFDFWTNPKTATGDISEYLGEYFKSAKAINNLTVQVNLLKPYSPLLSTLSQGYDGILAPATIKAGPEAACNEPIGTGPFVLQKWTHGQNITFTRNENYNSAPANALHQGPAYVEKLVWSYISDPTTRYGSLTTGQSNVIYDVPAVDWAEAKENYEVQQYITPGRPVTLDLNTTEGPFSEQKVREAFAYGANRKQAVESAFEGKVPYNGNGALSQTTPDFNPNLEETWPYNPEKAEALLDAAGWKKGSNGIRSKNGEELTISLVYGSGSLITTEGATALQDLQAQWKEVGFNVELKPATLTQLFSGQYAAPDKYDATIGYWTSPTPGVMLIVWRPWNNPSYPNGNNQSFYNDPHLVALIEKGNSSSDPAVQKKAYYEAQEIVTKQKAAVVGVYVQETSLAIEKNLHDVWLDASQGEPVFSDAYFGEEG